jgi:hypothetical protein
MAGRFLVTGTQLGMIKAFLKDKDALKMIDEIIEDQFVGNSDKSILDDVDDVAITFIDCPHCGEQDEE